MKYALKVHAWPTCMDSRKRIKNNSPYALYHLQPPLTITPWLLKWLEDELKPLSYNKYSILDIFEFAEEIRTKGINEDDILVSYDVVSLFTNVPLDETIGILVNKAFKDNWFNSQYNLNINRQDLTDLLNIATKDQLFQFEGTLYEPSSMVWL